MNTYHCWYCIRWLNLTDLLFAVIHNTTVLISITTFHLVCVLKKSLRAYEADPTDAVQRRHALNEMMQTDTNYMHQ